MQYRRPGHNVCNSISDAVSLMFKLPGYGVEIPDRFANDKPVPGPDRGGDSISAVSHFHYAEVPHRLVKEPHCLAREVMRFSFPGLVFYFVDGHCF